MSVQQAEQTGRTGAASETITEAVYRARPGRREWLKLDELRVTALYAECGGQAVCLLSYDLCEITRGEAALLRKAVGDALRIDAARVHVYCTHNHSSSCGGEHDVAYLAQRSASAAKKARKSARETPDIAILRIDTQRKYNINRRSQPGVLGVWSLMQAEGCTDDGETVDGTGWVRSRMTDYGATEEELAFVGKAYPATRANDGFLDLLLFAKPEGGYAAGIVRFTAHPVICSSGYWQANIGRDYPGVLCGRLEAEFGCPVLFLQGPCGDHRPRHRDVGIEERDRIGNALADELITQLDKAAEFRFDSIENMSRTVSCALRDDLPATEEEAKEKARQARDRLRIVPHGQNALFRRRLAAEEAAFYNNVPKILAGFPYLLPGEAESREAQLEISRVTFGAIHLLNFPGELFSTVPWGLRSAAKGPSLIASFADGAAGYLMPEEDFDEAGFEWTWAPFKPESVDLLRKATLEMFGRHEWRRG